MGSAASKMQSLQNTLLYEDIIISKRGKKKNHFPTRL